MSTKARSKGPGRSSKLWLHSSTPRFPRPWFHCTCTLYQIFQTYKNSQNDYFNMRERERASRTRLYHPRQRIIVLFYDIGSYFTHFSKHDTSFATCNKYGWNDKIRGVFESHVKHDSMIDVAKKYRSFIYAKDTKLNPDQIYRVSPTSS